uniref:Prominin 2 n=1 Tax=Corvus moneduloides TaxID=1196302 RepID=A0A8C3D4F5_CORMO
MRAAGLLLAWALLHPAATQPCHPASPGGVLRFTDRHAEIRVPALHRVPSSLDPLYGLVRRCLDLIQQNPLPTGEPRAGEPRPRCGGGRDLGGFAGCNPGARSAPGIPRGSGRGFRLGVHRLGPVTALNDPGSVRTSQVVQYELGYVVCAAVALLFTVAVPVAGMCFCYCRSRRRCGGRLRAHRRSLGCRRRCLLACLSFTSLIILISVTCAFVTSQRVKGQMEPGLGAVPSTLRTLRQHLMVVDKFEVPRKQIISDLGGKRRAGQHPELPPGMNEVLTGRRCLAGLSRSVGLSIHAQLKAMTYAALADLQDRAGDLQTSLHHLQILDRTARALAAARAELEPALRERRRRVVALLDDPRCTSCASVLGRAQSLELGADYGKVPSVEKVLKALAGLPRSDFAEMIRQGNGTFNSIPELAVERMAQVIQDLRDDLTRTAEKVQSIADSFPFPDYTRPVSEALLKAEDRSQPYLREAERFERYRWIAGTVLCSIILLILACNVTGMALGAYGLSKREDPSDYECRGEAGAKFLLVGVGLAFLFSWLLILLVFATFLVGGNIHTLVCRNWVNQEIYKFIDTPGNLPPSMNLTRQLNLRRDSNLSSAYRECKSGAGLWEVLQLDRSYDLDEHLKTPKYTADFQKRLGDFTANLGDVRLLRSEGRQDLETFARSGVDEVDYGRFQEEVRDAHTLPFTPRGFLGRRSPHGSLMDPRAEAAECIPGARGGLMRCPCSLFQLREDVASCQPLATALDNGRVILCDRIADPWNAFWFSLGCCTFFLIPNIIFAVRLTKHFRPIRNRLISTGSEETCPFHIPRVTALKL